MPVMTPTERSIERVRAYAQHKGWRKARLAVEAGLHANTLRSFDEDGWNPRIDTLQKLERLVPVNFVALPPDDLAEAS